MQLASRALPGLIDDALTSSGYKADQLVIEVSEQTLHYIDSDSFGSWLRQSLAATA